MSTNTNTKAPKAANTKAVKTNVASLTASQVETIAAGILARHGSRNAIKAHGAEYMAKYGRDNWKAIDKAIQAARESTIKAEADMARAGVRNWEKAIAEAWKAARTGGHFSKLANMAAAKYPNVEAFIAATYPNVIDGKPATKIAYVTKGGGTILEAYQLAVIDGRHARAIVDTCLGKMAGALKAANKGAKVYTSPAKARKAGAIVAAYNTKPGAVNGTIAKAEAVSPDVLAKFQTGNVAGLVTLSAHNAEGRRLADLAEAAGALAAINPGDMAGAISAAKALAAHMGAGVYKAGALVVPIAEAKPKAAKAPKGPKGPKVSPEAAKAAREAMAKAEATIAAGEAARRELSGEAEREAKAIAAAEAKAAKIAMLAEA